MKTKLATIVLALIVLLTACAGIGAASILHVDIDAESSLGSLTSSTELAYTQALGNGDLADNPPLQDGEGEASIGYAEDTHATQGNITYTKDLTLTTGAESSLVVDREIDYTDNGGRGSMTSEETVSVSEYSTGIKEDQQASCAFSTPSEQSEEEVTSATSVLAEAGSDVKLDEGHVKSDTTATIGGEEELTMDYSVTVDASVQTENETAIGSAEVFVDVNEKKGSGSDPTQETEMDYEESTTVDGLITLSMGVEYSKSAGVV